MSLRKRISGLFSRHSEQPAERRDKRDPKPSGASRKHRPRPTEEHRKSQKPNDAVGKRGAGERRSAKPARKGQDRREATPRPRPTGGKGRDGSTARGHGAGPRARSAGEKASRPKPRPDRPSVSSATRQRAAAAGQWTSKRVIAPARKHGATFVRGWLAVAERAGALVLAAWRRYLLPLLAALAALARAGYRVLERRLTPAGAMAAVCVVAIVALIASQWLDYRTVAIGTEGYSGEVEAVAAAPEVDSGVAGEAHGWLMVPLGVAALAALVIALGGRPRAARLLIVIGVVVVAISVLVDAPKGLDEGDAAVVYEGASASLVEGFWLQVATAAVLIAAGVLLPRCLGRKPGEVRSASRGPRPGLARRIADKLRTGGERPGRVGRAGARAKGAGKRRAEGAGG